MRILIIAPQPFYSERGTPIAVRLLAQGLCDAGHQVDLLTLFEGEDVAYPGLKIERGSKVPGVRHVPIGFSVSKLVSEAFMSARLLRLLTTRRYDVVHAVEEAVFLAVATRWLHRAPVVYDMDSSLSEQLSAGKPALLQSLYRAAEAWAIRHSERVIAVCEYLAGIARRIIPDDRVFVLQDVAMLNDDPATDTLSELFPESAPIALYVGSLASYQGTDLLLRSIALLPPSCRLGVVVIGGGEQQVVDLRRAAESRQIPDTRLRIIGSRPLSALASYLQQADILLSPRLSGGNTPMKIYSYMASGRAILATDVTSHTQVLDETNALLVAPEPEQFSDALRRLAADGELRRSLGESAKARAEREHSLTVFRAKLKSAYAGLIAKPGSDRSINTGEERT